MNTKIIKKPEKLLKESLDEKKGDRGDIFKKHDGVKSKISDLGSTTKTAKKPSLPDRGDVPIVNKVSKIPKLMNNSIHDKVPIGKVKKQNDNNAKLTAHVSPKVNTVAEKTSVTKTSEINNAIVNKTKVGENQLSDKVATKPKDLNIQHQGKESKIAVKSDLKTVIIKSASKVIVADSVKTYSTKAESDVIKKEKEKETPHRKPMIKTIKSKKDNRVYKAVTFTDQKRVKPTVLEINIPNVLAKKTKTKSIDKNPDAKTTSTQVNNNKSTSKLNVKEKTQVHRQNRIAERTKRKKLNRCISSPDKFKKAESPPTEVAKWTPSCLNTHTKPYYEAWVNTTLAAVSKISNKDKLYNMEKQKVMRTFEQSLGIREESPDLVHENFTDESYTGRIRIKQKPVSRKTRQPLITPLLDFRI